MASNKIARRVPCRGVCLTKKNHLLTSKDDRTAVECESMSGVASIRFLSPSFEPTAFPIKIYGEIGDEEGDRQKKGPRRVTFVLVPVWNYCSAHPRYVSLAQPRCSSS